VRPLATEEPHVPHTGKPKVSIPLTCLYETAIAASIRSEPQHRADIAVGRAVLRRERLTWAAVGLGSLGVELPLAPPAWTDEDEPHWPLTGAQHLLLRFPAPGEVRLSVLGRCACGEPATSGLIDPRLPDALASLGDAARSRVQCGQCQRAGRRAIHVLDGTGEVGVRAALARNAA
jgi:hypothetical protein